MKLFPQLINYISRAFEKLLKCFSGISVLTSFVSSSFVIFFCLNLNETILPEKLATVPALVKAGLYL